MKVNKELILVDQLKAKGIQSLKVLSATNLIDRENFVPTELKKTRLY